MAYVLKGGNSNTIGYNSIQSNRQMKKEIKDRRLVQSNRKATVAYNQIDR